VAYSFCSPPERGALREIESLLGAKIPADGDASPEPNIRRGGKERPARRNPAKKRFKPRGRQRYSKTR
jgi:hypothetical protein